MIGIDYDAGRSRLIAILKGLPCSWGQCIFCPFSKESTTNLEELLDTDLQIIREVARYNEAHKVERLSIFNGGSFFELPLYVTQQLSTVTKNKHVDIESLPRFIHEDTVKSVFNLLQPSILEIRLGLESHDDSIRSMLKKGISESEIERVSKLGDSLSDSMGGRVRFTAYVLFGMDGISEESVTESVRRFNQLFEGVIAIRYRRYDSKMPERRPVSQGLLDFLSKNCLEIDMTEGRSWEVG